MKKNVVTSIMAAALLAACTPVFASDSVDVYVTVSDNTLKAANQKIGVTDADGDGVLTLNDALYCAHEELFEGGASVGYGYADGDYGLYITRLWGVENGGSYGYYLNNASAMSLSDPVSDGDVLNAFAYSDTLAFSDTFCFFDENYYNIIDGNELTLTLMSAGYDENWNPITVPVSGAAVTVDGVVTDYITDENGIAKITVSGEGSHIISAVSDTLTLVPPASTVETCKAAAQTWDPMFITGISGTVFLAAAFITRRKHER